MTQVGYGNRLFVQYIKRIQAPNSFFLQEVFV